MIKSNELRIGNWVECEDMRYQVIDIYSVADKVCISYGVTVPLDYIEGMPLSPKILDKCGFKETPRGIEIEGWLPYLVCRKSENTGAVWYQVFNVADCTIKYVHQLQNLYFALTGEELTIAL